MSVELAPTSVRADLRQVAADALRLASRELGLARVPRIRWFDGPPPPETGASKALGFVVPDPPATVWLSRALNVRRAHRVVGHEARHAYQLEVLGETELGSDRNEADARRFESEFAKRHEWRFER